MITARTDREVARLPSRPERPVAAAVVEPEVARVEMPDEIARHLLDHEGGLGEVERQALRQGRTVRRGQGYSLMSPQRRGSTRHCLPPRWR
ncbi:MAG: hypothetical protein JO100_18870 [Pseudonocardia sp.]|nr:hypothetical protein [Pseudonocardia sp.]